MAFASNPLLIEEGPVYSYYTCIPAVGTVNFNFRLLGEIQSVLICGEEICAKNEFLYLLKYEEEIHDEETVNRS